VTRRVIVVGAGLAGLATARALAGEGIDVAVVEHRDRAPGAGLGLNLPGNAVRALGHLGVAERVALAGVPVRRREYRSAGDRLLFAVDEGSFWSGVAGSVCVRRGVVVDALADGVTVRWGASVTAVRPVATGVAVELGDGREESYDLVVGADGVNSVVRDRVAPEAPRPSLMTGASWRFVVENPGVDCWTVWTGHGVLFLMIPLAPGEVYVYAASNRGESTQPDPSWLTSAFARFPQPVRAAVASGLAAAEPPYHAPVEEVRASTWHAPSLLVMGDAAHATGPVWAQGAAMALEDALVLARLLASHEDWAGVGARWEALRRPRVDHVQNATDRMSRLARLPDRLLQLVAPVMGPRGYEHAYGALRPDPLDAV
jgi:2-polyprenyl-6-methoxyphenol hydroxylase-like FAD-dependent oxidoreductase